MSIIICLLNNITSYSLTEIEVGSTVAQPAG